VLPQRDHGFCVCHFAEHPEILALLNAFPIRIDSVMGDPRRRRGVDVTLLLTVFHPKQEPGSSVSEVTAKSIKRWRSEINDALFALALYEYLVRFEVNIFQAEVANLDQSASGTVQ